jgi:Tfp pilus assembly protein PilZ
VTKNLSTMGAMLLLPSRFGLGAEVTLRIELPDGGEALDLDAMIVWQDDAPRSPHPTGAHFLLPPAEAIARIRDLIYEP